MQETVSGYKLRIFHHYPGGRVWGRQAVVELAAWGFDATPWPGFLEDQGPFPCRRMGSAPGSTGPGSGMAWEQPCPQARGFRPLWHSRGCGGSAPRPQARWLATRLRAVRFLRCVEILL